MDSLTLASLRFQVCSRKVRLTRGKAMASAARVREDEEQTDRCAYRCPFAAETDEPGHWHVGQAPTMRTLELIAEHLRARHAGALPEDTAVSG